MRDIYLRVMIALICIQFFKQLRREFTAKQLLDLRPFTQRPQCYRVK